LDGLSIGNNSTSTGVRVQRNLDSLLHKLSTVLSIPEPYRETYIVSGHLHWRYRTVTRSWSLSPNIRRNRFRNCSFGRSNFLYWLVCYARRYYLSIPFCSSYHGLYEYSVSI